MSVKRLLAVTAAVSFFGSLLAFAFPSAVWSAFALDLGRGGLFIFRRYAGSAGLALALLAWKGRQGGREAQRLAIQALFAFFAVTLVVAITGPLTGVLNSLGWSIVVADLLFSVAFGAILFRRS